MLTVEEIIAGVVVAMISGFAIYFLYQAICEKIRGK
jgi:hypothetical protein